MDNLIKQVYVNDLNLQDVKLLTREKVPVILYDNLTINDDILNLLSKDGRALLLFPTGLGADGHWISILFNSNTRVLEHWDSYALTVIQEITYSRNPKVEQNILGKLYQKAQQQHGITIVYNTYRMQKMANNVNTCGRHSCVRLRFHYLNMHQYAKLMLGQTMSPDWIVSAITFLKLFQDGNDEQTTVFKYLGIKQGHAPARRI